MSNQRLQETVSIPHNLPCLASTKTDAAPFSHQQRRVNDTEPDRDPTLITLLALGPQQVPDRLVHQHLRAPSLGSPKQRDAKHAQLTHDLLPLPRRLARTNHDALGALGGLDEVHEDVALALEGLPGGFPDVLGREGGEVRRDVISVDVVPSAFALGFEDEALGGAVHEGEGGFAGGGGVEGVERGEGGEELGGVGWGEGGSRGRREVGGGGADGEETGEEAGGSEDLLDLLGAGELEGDRRAFDGEGAFEEEAGGPLARGGVVGGGVAGTEVNDGDFDGRVGRGGVRGVVRDEEGRVCCQDGRVLVEQSEWDSNDTDVVAAVLGVSCRRRERGRGTNVSRSSHSIARWSNAFRSPSWTTKRIFALQRICEYANYEPQRRMAYFGDA